MSGTNFVCSWEVVDGSFDRCSQIKNCIRRSSLQPEKATDCIAYQECSGRLNEVVAKDREVV